MTDLEKNWAREFAKGLISVKQLNEKEFISDQDTSKIEQVKDLFDIRVPHIFVEQISAGVAELKNQFIPSISELNLLPEEMEDPIGDEKWSPVAGITHRYPDRVLFKLTYLCASYCRFCFRRYKVSDSSFNLSEEEYKNAITYIKEQKNIWEVILTGGDPLTLTNQKLSTVINDLSSIEHVKIIRFHTRIPSVLPARINSSLLNILKNSCKQIVFVVHMNTHHEFNQESCAAIKQLRDNGVILLLQAVLLKNINDSKENLTLLFKTAVEKGIKPYYLHYLDLAKGTEHFRVPLKQAIELYNSLRGSLSGICIPEFIVDIPGGKGKIALQANNIVELDNHCWQFISPLDGSKVTVKYPEERDSK